MTISQPFPVRIEADCGVAGPIDCRVVVKESDRVDQAPGEKDLITPTLFPGGPTHFGGSFGIMEIGRAHV